MECERSCWCRSVDECACLDVEEPRWPKVLAAAAAVLVLAACVVMACGCAGADPALVTAADQFVNRSVGPEYEAWVRARGDLSEAEKADRLVNVSEFRKAVGAAQRLNGG